LLWINTGLYQPKGGIMRRYETIIIIDPDLSDEKREPVLKKVKDVIEQQSGYLAFVDAWGARKLAYEIKKKDRGYYVRFDFCGTGTVIDEIERLFRIDDRVLKYMTVLLDKEADIEKIKEEVAAAEIKAEVPEKQVEPSEAETPEAQAKPSEKETPEEQTKSSQIETPEQQVEPSEAETPEAQAKPSEKETPEEQTKPSKIETPEAQAKPSEIETPEETAKSSEIETPEQQAELSETQPPEPEANGADTTPTETEEEIK
jgi:small subunit ribosomal protein S6